MAEVLVAVAVHDGVEDGAGHADQVTADVDRDHRLAVHALSTKDCVFVAPRLGHTGVVNTGLSKRNGAKLRELS